LKSKLANPEFPPLEEVNTRIPLPTVTGIVLVFGLYQRAAKPILVFFTKIVEKELKIMKFNHSPESDQSIDLYHS
jgi:hypothetical protein